MNALLLGAALWLITGYVDVGTTASGVPTGPGVAACPPDLGFGTHLLVEGYGDAWCLDRYSPRLSRRLDLWVPDVPTAYAITGTRRVFLVTDAD